MEVGFGLIGMQIFCGRVDTRRDLTSMSVEAWCQCQLQRLEHSGRWETGEPGPLYYFMYSRSWCQSRPSIFEDEAD
jgi:hypothetical protein